jgi:hypothetical protein
MRSATASTAVETTSTTATVKTAATSAVTATTMLGESGQRNTHQRERRANYEDSLPKGGLHVWYLQPTAEPQGGWIVLKRILHHLTRANRSRLQLP